MKKHPIIIILGVEGQFYIAEALAKEFDLPIIGIISRERVHEMMTPEREALFDKLYSLPDYFTKNIDDIRALTREELDEEQTLIESKLGVNNSAFLTSADRRIRNIGDYRQIRNWQLCNLKFLDSVLNEITPVLVLDGVITYLQLALRKACEQREIPYILSMASRNNSYAFYHKDGQQIGMEKLFADIQNGDFTAIDAEKLKEADEAYQKFKEKPTRPAYADQNSLAKFNWPVLKHKLHLAFNKGKLFPSERVKQIDIFMNAELPFGKIVLNFIRTRYRRFLIKTFGIFEADPDLTKPNVYVPLHFSPEISDLYFGTEYDHHESFISHLAKYMPSDTQLYVKEHTSMIGRRPISFYTNLKKLYNVEIIDPRVSTFKMIEHAKATITVTGTPGWEAFLLGKPAVAFGKVFYNHMPGVLHAPLKEGFEEIFANYLKTFEPDPDTILNVFRAYYLTTYAGIKVDVGYTSDKKSAHDHAALFAQSLKLAISRWHKEMQGEFSEILIANHEETSNQAKTKIHA